MFTTQSIDYSLSLPTRCLSSLPHRSSSSEKSSWNKDETNNDEDGWDDDSYNVNDNDDDVSDAATCHRFLVGSARPSVISSESVEDDKENDEEEEEHSNHLHLLAYHEDTHEITLEASYAHPTGEIWSMAVNLNDGTVATCGGGVFLGHGSFESHAEGGTAGGTKLVDFATKVWKLQHNEGSAGDEMRLEPLVTIPHGEKTSSQSGWEKRVGCILWNPLLYTDESTDGQVDASLLTVGWDASSPVSLWDISTSSAVELWSSPPSSSHTPPPAAAAAGKRSRRRRTHPLQYALPRRASWDPHDPRNVLCTAQQDVVAYDTRCSGARGVEVIRSAHRYGVADVDHNRLQEHVVVTSGLDGVVKFWDLRMNYASMREEEDVDADTSFFSLPRLLKTVRGGHSHWATRAAYNPFYDQLVLSGGTDGIANLWRVSSCSSAPLLEFDGEDEDIDNDEEGGDDALEEDINEENFGHDDWVKEEKEEYLQNNPLAEGDKQTDEKNQGSSKLSSNDVRVSRFECSDTTADVCWSASDPWIYATLSCDGSLVVHHVPSKEKYKILL
ncbi:hypothetical protein ACHAW6_009206 [Cyclotella cf. meneghiniana]